LPAQRLDGTILIFAASKVQQHWSEEVWDPGQLSVTGSPNA
jgi:hypothetical protein